MNVVVLMIHQMDQKKVNIEINIYLAPIVCLSSNMDFKGLVSRLISLSDPYFNDKAFIERALTPFPDDGGNGVENEPPC